MLDKDQEEEEKEKDDPEIEEPGSQTEGQGAA